MAFPLQYSGGNKTRRNAAQAALRHWDIRNDLNPRRLTLVMWDQAFLFRHNQGGAFANYDRVLDETLERGYNTVRIDPLPGWLDLSRPEALLEFRGNNPLMPWGGNRPVAGPMARWLEAFMGKMLRRKLHYTLSAWWIFDNCRPPLKRAPQNHLQAAEIWLAFLKDWRHSFGFDGCVYVDICNEVPYFMGTWARLQKKFGQSCWANPSFSPKLRDYLAQDINAALFLLRKEYPELRFTVSLHGDLRWLDVPLELDCQDIHFYTEADPRWSARTRFAEFMPRFMRDRDWHREFSERCAKTHLAVTPIVRARQRHKLALFAEWAETHGMPLTTSESWSSWYYLDSPDLDWGWLCEYAEHTVQDALDFRMWGWTPHNYCQPQFANWKDVKWHQKLTRRFLKG